MMEQWIRCTSAEFSGPAGIYINLARAISMRWDEQKSQTVMWFGDEDVRFVRETPQELIEKASAS
jgi:hypothetical protein